ncbi:hypothetical protein FQR65_LT20696 [Abscondita terminalis]|nr:hypothetical protein FQR65_LT20696 [Abscondita terminalis]
MPIRASPRESGGRDSTPPACARGSRLLRHRRAPCEALHRWAIRHQRKMAPIKFAAAGSTDGGGSTGTAEACVARLQPAVEGDDGRRPTKTAPMPMKVHGSSPRTGPWPPRPSVGLRCSQRVRVQLGLHADAVAVASRFSTGAMISAARERTDCPASTAASRGWRRRCSRPLRSCSGAPPAPTGLESHRRPAAPPARPRRTGCGDGDARDRLLDDRSAGQVARPTRTGKPATIMMRVIGDRTRATGRRCLDRATAGGQHEATRATSNPLHRQVALGCAPSTGRRSCGRRQSTLLTPLSSTCAARSGSDTTDSASRRHPGSAGCRTPDGQTAASWTKRWRPDAASAGSVFMKERLGRSECDVQVQDRADTTRCRRLRPNDVAHASSAGDRAEVAQASGIRRIALSGPQLEKGRSPADRAEDLQPGPDSHQLSTSAAALPSGNGNGSSMIIERRSGTENNKPSKPPSPAMPSTHQYLKSTPAALTRPPSAVARWVLEDWSPTASRRSTPMETHRGGNAVAIGQAFAEQTRVAFACRASTTPARCRATARKVSCWAQRRVHGSPCWQKNPCSASVRTDQVQLPKGWGVLLASAMGQYVESGIDDPAKVPVGHTSK